MNKKKIFYLVLILSFSFIVNLSAKEKLVVLESKNLPSADSILIVTPENFNNDSTYSLVILLHGYSGNFLQWNNIANLQDYANAYNFIIACPDGFYDSWYLNSTLKPELQFEDFFWKDFIPYLNQNYKIDSSNIFISGLSMGGHGAITLFLKNSDFFRSAGSTSGILDLTYFPDRWSIKNGIGSIKDYPKIWKNNSAYYLLDKNNLEGKKIIVDCGTEDFAYQVNLNFVKKCYDIGSEVLFYSQPGNHNRDYWEMMLPKHLKFFYKQQLKN
ncbi:MAG: hypothetical protein CR986_07405 [Ignavibacteriae bacterium]|nr:MAG: hypothetical protein CR986_07405 [Ignavibacteriota bacterium]